jgi:hypothetical protein
MSRGVCGAPAVALLACSVVFFAAQAPPASASPQIDYMLECQGCHLRDGSGSPGVVPRLTGSVARFLTLPEGRAYLVRVPGVAQAPLGDAALAAVLNWLVAEFGPADLARAAAPYTEAEVAQLRGEPLLEVKNVREALILRLEREEGSSAVER